MDANASRHGGTRIRWTAAVVLALGALLALAPRVAAAGAIEKGRAAAAAGKWAEAADQFAAALKEGTQRRDAVLGLTEAAIKAGRTDLFAEVENTLLALREKTPQDWDVRIALGEISQALGASKDDTLAKKSYDAQAIDSFSAALAARPDSEPAAAGLARTHFESGSFQAAIDVVDAFLAKGPKTSARALYWKGQALYFQAQDAFRGAGGTYPLPPAVETLFRQAQGAYRSSAAGDPSSYDAWMQLAYASQYVGDRDTALEAYEKAATLNLDSPYPFRGFEALFAHDPAALAAVLKKTVDANPKHPQALFFYAYNRHAANDHKAAVDLFERFVKVAAAPAEGWYWMGRSLAALGEEKKAVAAFEKALEASAEHDYAAAELDQRIVNTGVMDKARGSLKGAKEVIAAYQSLLKLAPRNPYVRNNLAFTLREAYVAHQGDKSWVPILEAATQYYVEASDIIGEWDATKERTLTWAQRYAQAQIISDTGLMFQFYEPTRDYEKAERYYDRALEYTDDGYRDAFNNLTQILAEQERWQDLYELAEICSEAIKTEQDQPDEATRARAVAIMKKLKSEGKIQD